MSLGRGSLSEEGLPVCQSRLRRSEKVPAGRGKWIRRDKQKPYGFCLGTLLCFLQRHRGRRHDRTPRSAVSCVEQRRAARGDTLAAGTQRLRALVQMLKLNTASPEGALRIWLGRVCCEVSKSFLLRFTLIYPFQHYRRLRPERPRASHFKNTHARTAGRVPLRRMTGSLPGIWLA